MRRVPTLYEQRKIESDRLYAINWNRLDKKYYNKRKYHWYWLIATFNNYIYDNYKLIKTKDYKSIILQSKEKYKNEWIDVFIVRTSRNCYRIMYRYYKGLVYGSGNSADAVLNWLLDNLPRGIKPTLKNFIKVVKLKPKNLKLKVELQKSSNDELQKKIAREKLQKALDEHRKSKIGVNI